MLNDTIREVGGVVEAWKKSQERRLHWHGYVMRRMESHVVRRGHWTCMCWTGGGLYGENMREKGLGERETRDRRSRRLGTVPPGLRKYETKRNQQN